MSFLPRKVEICAAMIAMAAWAGCASGPQSHDANRTRELFTAANDRATATVIGGVGLFESIRTGQSRFEEFLYGPQSTESRRLRTPQGLAAGGSVLLVCDQGYPDVLAIHPENATFRSATTRAHRPATPIAVAVDEAMNVYVADATRKSVLIFGSDGTFVQEIAPSTPFEPTALGVRDHVLFVADRAGRQIARFDLSTQSWLTPLAPRSDQPAMAVPAGLAWGTDGVLLVTDALLGIVHRMEPGGTWLAPQGARGRAEGQLVRPIGICTTPSGLVVVADAARQTIVVLGMDGSHVIDIHSRSEGIATWTLPTGLACLPAQPAIPGLNSRGDLQSGDWIVVSDMLGENGLSIVHLKTGKASEGNP